jgi:leader peptidase (prepilin peptidase) / N-methyltransferase
VTGLPDPLRWLAAAWSFAVGAAVGSFLNVVIARVPRGESIVRPASRCPTCRTPISWRDNVPILSWFLLRGRCRTCATRISWRYPAVEALGGVVALVVFARHGLTGTAAAELAFAAALVALALIDVDTWTLPHAITIPLIAAGVVLSTLGATHCGTWTSSLVGAAAGWLAFAAVAFIGERVLKKEALGFGDVWLLSAIGAWLGPASLLPVVLLASLQGTVVGLVLIALGRAQTGEPPGVEAPDPAPAAATPGTPATPPAGHPEPPPPTATGPGDAPATSEDDWIPPRNAVPFGPFLSLGALEWLWLQGALVHLLPALRIFT